MSLIERLSINSFLQQGHTYHLYCYDEVKNVPPGTILRDAAEILPASEIFYYQRGKGKGSVAAFANLFRYKLLLERGGWWVDTDIVCLQPFNFSEPLVFASERNGDATQITNAVIRIPPGHEVARLCYEAAQQNAPAQLTWGQTGPRLINQIVHETGWQHFVKEPEVFCPLDHWKWQLLLKKNDPSAPVFTDKSHAIHLWHEFWRRAHLKVDPATGEFQPMNFIQKLWRQMRRKPIFEITDTETVFADLVQRYAPALEPGSRKF